MRINVGCGMTPTQGWLNFDNSMSLRIAKIPLLASLLGRLGLLTSAQLSFITFARGAGIRYGDAVGGLDLESNSVEVLYTSHMLEHLDRRGGRGRRVRPVAVEREDVSERPGVQRAASRGWRGRGPRARAEASR